jgi:hypothetical protein
MKKLRKKPPLWLRSTPNSVALLIRYACTREMGTVELLTREGEIRIAKRIEEGLMRSVAVDVSADFQPAAEPVAGVRETVRLADDCRFHRPECAG